MDFLLMDNNLIGTQWAFPQTEYLSLGAWPSTRRALPCVLCAWNMRKHLHWKPELKALGREQEKPNQLAGGTT